MDKQYKVIDDRGRLTIPRSVRFLTGITANSIVSLTFSKDEIIIKKEKICDNCQNEKEEKETITLAEFLNQLPEAEQDARYSQENKNWSELIAIPDSNLRNEYLINNHPVLINALIDKTRIAFDELHMFSADDCESMAGQELTGKVLILKPSILADEYKSPDNQLFLATAGFGCSPSSLGRSIYGIFLKDNEYTSFYRQDFLGIARDDVVPDWAKSKLETQESESLETVQQM